MDIQGYFTAKGLNLSAKLLSGATLEITRVAAGSGHTEKPASATSLPDIQQTLAVNTPTHSGNTAVIPATLAAAQAAADYTLTELGVYAKDSDQTEILYKIYKLSEPVNITAGGQMVLRFYLEETVSEDVDVMVVCSPAGLITETDFAPVRDRVEAASVASRSVTVAAEDLQAYLDSLPRLLTETLEINVTGDLTGNLDISNFYGSASWLEIQPADPDGTCTISGTVTVGDCSVPIRLIRLHVQVAAGKTHGLYSYRSMKLSVEKCSFSGPGSETGVHPMNSMLYLSNCSISGFATAVQTSGDAVVTIANDVEDSQNFHDNSIGAYVWHGGLVEICDKTPSLLGGASHKKTGGLIVGSNGTLL